MNQRKVGNNKMVYTMLPIIPDDNCPNIIANNTNFWCHKDLIKHC